MGNLACLAESINPKSLKLKEVQGFNILEKKKTHSLLNAFLWLQGKQDRTELEGLKHKTAKGKITSGMASSGVAVVTKSLLELTVSR